MALKKYNVTNETGYTTTLLLSTEDAKARGLWGKDVDAEAKAQEADAQTAADAQAEADAKAAADAKAKEEADAQAAADAKAKEDADAKAAADGQAKQASAPQNKQAKPADTK